MSITRTIQLSAAGLILLIALVFGFGGLTFIEPGEVGVKVKQLGENKGMQSETLDTGTHWINPIIYDVPVYDTRLKQHMIENLPANTKDGQPIELDVSLEIGLFDANVPFLHETVGKNWFHQVVYPAARSTIRNSVAEKLSDEVYTGAGQLSAQVEITKVLELHVGKYGILINVNLRDISFLNPDFVKTLERKAQAAQEQIIQQRLAEAAVQEALKVKNKAEGAKFKTIQEAEAERERLKLQGQGQRLQQEEIALGILAVATAEAEGIRLRNLAYSGEGGDRLVSIAWAENMGPNVKIIGFPTGSPGITSIMDLNGMLKGIMPKGVN